MSGQKFIKNAQNGQFWRGFWKPEAFGQALLPDGLSMTVFGIKTNISLKWDYFHNFKHSVHSPILIRNVGVAQETAVKIIAYD